MTRKEAERLARQADTLRALGFTAEEAESLRRISMTLHRWHEHECNGTIQRDEEIGSATEGRPFYWFEGRDGMHRKCGQAPDREKGALKRLAAIVNARNDRQLQSGAPIDVKNPPLLRYYIQGDPRGAALYIIRPGDVPAGANVDGCYSRGVCVY